jgi:hypothetical protein
MNKAAQHKMNPIPVVIFRKNGEVKLENWKSLRIGLKFDIVLKNKTHEISQNKVSYANFLIFFSLLEKLYGQSGKC